MARYRDDGEVQIDNSTKVHFRNAFQQLIMIAALNVGTLLIFNLAKNAGTSVDQIERFYARNLPLSKEMAINLQSFGSAST